MARTFDILSKVGDEAAFRQEIRDWLAAAMPRNWRSEWQGLENETLKPKMIAWLEERRKVGLATPHWPKEWGGPGLPFGYQIIVYEELTSADAPELHMYMVSLFQTPATLFEHGSPAQKEKYLAGCGLVRAVKAITMSSMGRRSGPQSRSMRSIACCWPALSKTSNASTRAFPTSSWTCSRPVSRSGRSGRSRVSRSSARSSWTT
jgi:alkylation response protein AidB-like acyl-CoA dehydrogenase